MKEKEHIVRVAPIPQYAHPLPAGYLNHDKALCARWAGIAISVGAKSRVPSYLLYWLGEGGTLLDFMDYESMEIALDQAAARAMVAPVTWRRCKIPVYIDGRVDQLVFAQYALRIN